MRTRKETRKERLERLRNERRLRKRVEGLETHLRFLHSLAADPSTIDREVRRRRRHIERLKTQIAAHEDAITHLEDQRDNVLDLIPAAQAKRKSLIKSLNLNLIEKLRQEWLAINKELKEERDASSVS